MWAQNLACKICQNLEVSAHDFKCKSKTILSPKFKITFVSFTTVYLIVLPNIQNKQGNNDQHQIESNTKMSRHQCSKT